MRISDLARKAASAYGLEVTEPFEHYQWHHIMDVLQNGTTIGRIAYVDGRSSDKYKFTVQRGMITYIPLADEYLQDSIPVCFLHGFPASEKITYIMGDDLRGKVERRATSTFGNNYEYFGFEDKPYALGTFRRIMRMFQDIQNQEGGDESDAKTLRARITEGLKRSQKLRQTDTN